MRIAYSWPASHVDLDTRTCFANEQVGWSCGLGGAYLKWPTGGCGCGRGRGGARGGLVCTAFEFSPELGPWVGSERTAPPPPTVLDGLESLGLLCPGCCLSNVIGGASGAPTGLRTRCSKGGGRSSPTGGQSRPCEARESVPVQHVHGFLGVGLWKRTETSDLRHSTEHAARYLTQRSRAR